MCGSAVGLSQPAVLLHVVGVHEVRRVRNVAGAVLEVVVRAFDLAVAVDLENEVQVRVGRIDHAHVDRDLGVAPELETRIFG